LTQRRGYIVRRLDFDDFLVREARQRPEISLMEGLEIKDLFLRRWLDPDGWRRKGSDTG
jgi:hypothetical protein